MSFMVLVYQLLIFSIVALSGGNTIVTLLAVAWTWTHLFWPPLIILQLFVIAFGWIVGRALRGIFRIFRRQVLFHGVCFKIGRLTRDAKSHIITNKEGNTVQPPERGKSAEVVPELHDCRNPCGAKTSDGFRRVSFRRRKSPKDKI